MLANTVRRENFNGYTIHNNIRRVREAQHIQGMITNPTNSEFAGIACERLLTNCPVTVLGEIDNVTQILDPISSNSGAR
jgi:hypothetical protein